MLSQRTLLAMTGVVLVAAAVALVAPSSSLVINGTESRTRRDPKIGKATGKAIGKAPKAAKALKVAKAGKYAVTSTPLVRAAST